MRKLLSFLSFSFLLFAFTLYGCREDKIDQELKESIERHSPNARIKSPDSNGAEVDTMLMHKKELLARWARYNLKQSAKSKRGDVSTTSSANLGTVQWLQGRQHTDKVLTSDFKTYTYTYWQYPVTNSSGQTNAALLVFDNFVDARRDYYFVNISPGSGNNAIINYYNENQLPDARISIVNGQIGEITDYLSLSSGFYSCVASNYRYCKSRGSTSCEFWNDWFGGICNKAIWVSSVAICSKVLQSNPCAGF